PAVQVGVLQALGAHHIEVRGAWDTNIVELPEDQLDRLAKLLRDRGMGVSAIASPVGKVDVFGDPDAELARLRRAIAAAHRLGARYVRMFSFYRPEGVPVEQTRDTVLTRLRGFADLAEREGVVLVHENEKDIYGDVPQRVLDLVESVGSPALRLAWDSANFVQVGVRPFTDGYAMLRPHLEYLQVKDAVAAPDAGIDLVAICTPSGLHAEDTELALAAGRHVFVEKPLDVSLPRARRLARLAVQAEQRGLVVSVVSQHRFDPASVAVAGALAAGRLGRVTSAVASVAWWRGQDYYDSAAWRGTWALDGGGALMNQGVHTVDLLGWLLGEPVEVFAHTGRLAHDGIEVEDVAVATI